MSGIDIVTGYIGIEEEIKNADMVITGEGKIDGQTLMGKTPAGIAKIAKKYNKPVYAFAGMIDESGVKCLSDGLFDRMFRMRKDNDCLEELMKTEISVKRLSDLAVESLRDVCQKRNDCNA